jgi:hypothetical protein
MVVLQLTRDSAKLTRYKAWRTELPFAVPIVTFVITLFITRDVLFQIGVWVAMVLVALGVNRLGRWLSGRQASVFPS